MEEQINHIIEIVCTKKKTKNYIKLKINQKVIPKYKLHYSVLKHLINISFFVLISFVIVGAFVCLISKTNFLSFELKKLHEENENFIKISHNYKKKIIALLEMRKNLKNCF